MKKHEIRIRLKESGLKVTPQRLLIMKIVSEMKNHPTTDLIIYKVREVQPDISPATVYKTLDTLVQKGLICKIRTEDGSMRYDPVTRLHHHLYNTNTGEIKDYHDEDLNRILQNYFNHKKIPGFKLEDFRIEINGIFEEGSGHQNV